MSNRAGGEGRGVYGVTTGLPDRRSAEARGVVFRGGSRVDCEDWRSGCFYCTSLRTIASLLPTYSCKGLSPLGAVQAAKE